MIIAFIITRVIIYIRAARAKKIGLVNYSSLTKSTFFYDTTSIQNEVNPHPELCMYKFPYYLQAD